MGGKELSKASKLFRRKKYAEVIRLLEPQVFRFRQNAAYYYLLGTSYLYTGDISGAQTYIERVIQLEPRNTEARNVLAAVNLKMGRNDEAILNWLRVLEDDPKNGVAKKGLELLRKTATESDQLERFLDSSRFFSLVPSNRLYVHPVLIAAVLLIFVVPLALYFFPRIQNIFPPASEERNPEVTEIEVTQSDRIFSYSGSFQYMLTEEEIRETFRGIKDYFNTNRDNLARREINRLLESNAAQSIKDKAATIAGYLDEPDFQTFQDNFSYAEIILNPSLYKNCYVRWKGKASNLEITEKVVRFDFLVGYHDGKTLEGIVPVTFPFAVSAEQGQSIEIIGQVLVNGGLKLEGTSFRPIYEVSQDG